MSAGGTAMACAIDLAEEESVRDLCAITRERFGRIDILHNNAADTRISQMAADAAIEDMACGIWDRAFTLNVRCTLLLIKQCVHSMIRSEKRHVGKRGVRSC